jgi:hypothetical protein
MLPNVNFANPKLSFSAILYLIRPLGPTRNELRMRRRAKARGRRRKRGNAEWEPKVNEKVLVKTQQMSDAVKGITAKFMHIFEGPFLIGRILDHSAYELKDECGKIRGEFNKKQLKQYKEEREDQVGEE